MSKEFWSPTAITGYRAWRVVPDGMLVSHISHTRWWTRKTLRAWCPSPAHRTSPPPHEDHSPCGIYAFATYQRLIEGMLIPSSIKGISVEDLVDVMVLSSIGEEKVPLVFGTVALSGKVIEHARGYRAQHATVSSLVQLRSNVDHYWGVSDDYDVPVATVDWPPDDYPIRLED